MIFGARTFSMKLTEGIDHIDAKSPAPAELVGVEERHVVCIERVRQHRVPLAGASW